MGGLPLTEKIEAADYKHNCRKYITEDCEVAKKVEQVERIVLLEISNLGNKGYED
jgi:hypothetical protein